MALDGNRLGDAVVAALMALNPNIDPTEETRLKEFWEAIGTQIVAELVNNGQVLPGTFVAGSQSVTGLGEIE